MFDHRKWKIALITLAVGIGAGGLAAEAVEFTVADHGGAAGRIVAPARFEVELSPELLRAAGQKQLILTETTVGGGQEVVPAQFEPEAQGSARGRVCWIMPAGAAAERSFRLSAATPSAERGMVVRYDQDAQRMDLFDGEAPVLRYNYGTVPMPPGVKANHEAGHYPPAVYGADGLARGNYVHPLYGPDGEILTRDYALDHPHHRGLYWAWPEVRYNGELNDLHATKNVHARPVAVKRMIDGPVFALLETELVWKWLGGDQIVKEEVVIRAWKGSERSRFVDFEFRFTGLVDGVTIARRGQSAYGGFNMRFAAGTDTKTTLYTDPPDVAVRRGWGDIVNTVPGGKGPAGMACVQHRTNPEYPGDWVEYPGLPWYQPTFPSSGTMYPLKKGETTTLRYRLWIRPGQAAEDALADVWSAYNYPPQKPGAIVELDHVLGYKFGQSRRPLIAIEKTIAKAQGPGKLQIERQLLQLLNSPKASRDLKVWGCQQLQTVASDNSVPSLAALLGDESLSHLARYALDSVPGPSADKALCESLGKIESEGLKVGVVNTLGERRDRDSVPAVTAVIGDGQSNLGQAALAALGKIGGPHAAKALSESRVSASAAEHRDAALLACAETLSDKDAAATYGQLWAEDKPLHHRRAALIGLARTDKQQALQIVLDCLQGNNADLRLAALQALGSVGNASHVPLLAEDATTRQAAMTSLVALQADGVDETIVDGLKTAPTGHRIVLARVAAARGHHGAVNALLKSAAHENAELRIESFKALAVLAGENDVPALIEALATTDMRQEAKKAIVAACGRKADPVLAALPQANAETRISLLSVLTVLAGDTSLSPAQSAAMYHNAMQAAERAEEKKLVLAGLAQHKNMTSLSVAAEYLDDPALAADAARAVAEVALPPSANVQGLVGSKASKALERAAALVDDEALVARIKAYLNAMPETDEFNLALGKAARGSVASQGPGTPDKAVDGNMTLGSFWSGDNTPSWLEVDLGEPSEIGSARLVLYYADARYYQYKLDVSPDGKTWTTVIDGSKNTSPSTAGGFYHKFEKTTARYVRAHILKNSANPGAHIVELKVYVAGYTPPGESSGN